MTQGWRELQEILNNLKAVEEQFKRGLVSGSNGDATFSMAHALKQLDEGWNEGRRVIKGMRVKNRLKTKADSV